MYQLAKSHREGHSVESLGNALSKVIVALIFGRKGESYVNAMRQLFIVVLDEREKISINVINIMLARNFGHSDSVKLWN